MTQQSKTASAAFQADVDSLRTGVKPPVGGVEHVKFPGGKSMSIATQPHEDDATTAIGADALAALHSIHQAAQDAAGDKRLSDHGKRERLVEQAAPHIRTIANQHAAVDALDAAANAREAEHYTPVALKPTDTGAAITDGQVRSQYHAMTPDQQNAVLGKVRGGNLPTVADALARDPFGASDAAMSAWKMGMDQRAPAVRAEIDAARRNAGWARHLVKRTAEAAQAASGMRRHEILAALGKGHPGGKVFGIQPFEKPQEGAGTSGLESQSSNTLAIRNV
ncbi:hypothetical protein WL67_11570 [Burkholderia ubonensis]|nr:hypothetical protein WJ45_23005 [Burkholderia ubonensis]KVQ37735.1 hypothetical protein WK04_24530 [Burkholderia ubonensis]KWC51562.1 hypothetical protein WL53_02055 [Burkholderia ubonensis]KWD56699.1 hypothetical protein WL67_11570 [Burkholderia ubonensis]KWD61640.1 hypothetical protein WL66_33570 [Burkholderia ubonensis]